jgi:hypothetical protein
MFSDDVWSQNIVVGIVTRIEVPLKNRGSILGMDKEIFPSPRHPDRVWGTISRLFNGYKRSYPGVKRAEA